MPQARRKQISSDATRSSWCLVVLQPPDGDWCSSAGTFLSLTYLLLRTFTCFQSLLESILMSVLKTLHCTSCSKKELTNEKTQLLVHHDNCILFEKSNPCLLESQDIIWLLCRVLLASLLWSISVFKARGGRSTYPFEQRPEFCIKLKLFTLASNLGSNLVQRKILY